MSKKKTHEQFVEEIKLKNKHFNDIELLSEYSGIKNKTKCRCKICNHEWSPIAGSLTQGYGCPKCGNKQVGQSKSKPLKDFLDELYKIRNDIEYVSGYNSMKSKSTFKCKKHNTLFTTTAEAVLKGVGCELCRKEIPKYNQLTKDKINESLSHLKIEMIGEYVNSKTPTEFKCQLCGKEFVSKYDLIRSWKLCGCKDCKNKDITYNASSRYYQHKKELLEKKIENLYNNKSKYVDILSYDEKCITVKCKCKICNKEYETSYDSLILGSNHNACASRISGFKQLTSKEKVIEKVKSYGNNIIIDFSNYNSSYSELKCICSVCGHKWKSTQRYLVSGRGCPICAQKRRDESKYKSLDDYDKLLKDMNLSVVSKYVNGTTPVILRCNICGEEFESTMFYISSTLIGCKKCTQENNRILKLNTFIDKLHKKNSTIKLVENFVDMSTTATFLCTNCNRKFKRTPHDLLKSCNCPNCTTGSKLEYYIKLYLDKHEISYDLHYSFDGLYGINGGLLSYDFYLPKHDILIEAQGKQHSEPVEYFGGEKQFKIQKEHDLRKREYAKKNGIKLIEIWYTDIKNIDNILDRKLYNFETKKAS